MKLPQVLLEADIETDVLRDRTVAVIGYGSQGSAQARNLRDSGVRVVVGQRPGANFDLAREHGFSPLPAAEAAAQADIIQVMLPDQHHGPLYAAELAPHVTPGKALCFGHGFSIHYGTITPPAGVDVYLVAAKGPGPLVRSSFEAGEGVPCLVAVHQDATGHAHDLALAHAVAIGGGRAGILQTTFQAETETDLFGEQAVLCGGVSALVRAAFDTLVEAGYPPEMAYIECIQELRQTVDLVARGGVNHMRARISDTAEFGDYTRGARIVTDATRHEMRTILAEIRSGQFAREWIADTAAGNPILKARRSSEPAHPSEAIGEYLRTRMKWPGISG